MTHKIYESVIALLDTLHTRATFSPKILSENLLASISIGHDFRFPEASPSEQKK